MKALLAVLAYAIALQGAVAADPIPTTSDWLTLSNRLDDANYVHYRRYAFLDDPVQPIPNVLLLNCAKGDYYTHITLELPKSFALKSFARDSWFPKLAARFLVDGKNSFTMEGEYHDGEFFFDDSPDQHDRFLRVLAAHTLAIGFGDRNDTIAFAFEDAMNAKMDAALAAARTEELGTVTFYDPATTYKRCGL
jgi:hypothetical protein